MILKRWLEHIRFFGRVFSKHPRVPVGGLTFVDLRTDRFIDSQQLEQTLKEALEHVANAGGGFPELVTSHLRQVIAIDLGGETVSPLAESYYTFFPAIDRQNTFFLATKLVWAATYIRILRNKPWWKRKGYRSRAAAQAREAQLRFVRQFPDLPEWEAYFSKKTE